MRAPMGAWLVTITQLPTEDPAARMRVLRTLESLGAAVMREGAYLLPDTGANRQALEALAEYIGKSAGSAQVLQVNALTPGQETSLKLLFDPSGTGVRAGEKLLRRAWATRNPPWADRLACAWLIRRFVDPEATLTWLEKNAEASAGALGFA